MYTNQPSTETDTIYLGYRPTNPTAHFVLFNKMNGDIKSIQKNEGVVWLGKFYFVYIFLAGKFYFCYLNYLEKKKSNQWEWKKQKNFQGLTTHYTSMWNKSTLQQKQNIWFFNPRSDKYIS